MLRLSEIAALKVSVDDDWRSAVADCVGQPWELAAGTLRWWRSSGSHVFVVPDQVDPRGVLYARFAPWGTPAGRRLSAGAARHAQLEARSAAVATTVPSNRGVIVERVSTPLGDMVASMVLRVEGEELDVDDLTPEQAFAWGDALAAFHGVSEPLEPGTIECSSFFAGLTGRPDDEVTLAVRTLDDAHQQLPPSPWVLGHGDFELDNLRWQNGRAVCFDLDVCGPMPRAMDIAAATGDLSGVADGGPGHPLLLERFLDGYAARSGERVTREELLVSQAMLAARELASLQQVIDLPEPDTADLGELRGKLITRIAQDRDFIVAAAQSIT